MGPAPMIRIVEMSVLLGIASVVLRTKKERADRAPAPGLGPARGGLRPDSTGRQRWWFVLCGTAGYAPDNKYDLGGRDQCGWRKSCRSWGSEWPPLPLRSAPPRRRRWPIRA